MSTSELHLIREGGEAREVRLALRELVTLNLLWICLMYFCYGYCLYFYLTWLPTYLRDARGFSTGEMVGYAVKWWNSWSIPLLIAAGVAVLCGLFTLLIDTRHAPRAEQGG